MSGLITTFYSYKGGVGRSFLLANVGTLLAKWGYRVLCVDWDIEAPGLDEYFRPWLGKRAGSGLVELATAVSKDKSPNWRNYVSKINLDPKNPLSVMTSGKPNKTFMQRVQALNWRDLYDKKGFGNYLEKMREEWKQSFDFVLVDSRTGISDIGGICTIHLPDILVFVFTANHQSLQGVTKVVNQVKTQRSLLPLNRAALLTLPVASRFDARGQDDIATKWMKIFTSTLEPFYEPWLEPTLSTRQILDLTRIPYFSVWTFGERLTVLEERENDPERISYHFATIAALLANGLGNTDQLVNTRDSYLAGSKKGARNDPVTAAPSETPLELDYFIVFSNAHPMIATEVGAHLKLTGARTRLASGLESEGPEDVPQTFGDIFHSKTLIVFVSHKLSTWDTVAVTVFVRGGTDPKRRVLVVKLDKGAVPKSMAEPLSLLTSDQVVYLEAASLSSQQIARRIRALEEPPKTKEAPIDKELLQLADDYVKDGPSHRSSRVARKNQLAEKMAGQINKKRISRDALAKAKHDGLTAALAVASAQAPETGDLERLLRIGPQVKRLHPAYKVLLAISSLFETKKANERTLKMTTHLLESYKTLATKKKDSPLLALVETTQRRMDNFL